MIRTNNPLLLGTVIASLMAGTALAEGQATGTKDKMTPPAASNSTMQKDSNAMNKPSGTTGMGSEAHGIAIGTTAANPVRYGNVDPADLWSSKLIGANVYNNNNEKIGEISDLAIDKGRTVAGVVLSVGGFLGMGERYVLIEPASLAVRNDNGTWKAYVNTNKESLKQAPAFKYESVSKKS